MLAFVAACAATRAAETPSVQPVGSRDESKGTVPTAVTQQIDDVMQPWATHDTPGCAVAVVQRGEVTFAKGYGMADLEHGVPITPETVFDIGSTSKQFTASAVLLAAAEGKLRVEDDVRKHLPELPELGPKPTTIEHLLHHSGGLRDYGMLLLLTGRRLDGVATAQETLDLLSRQRGRDFVPGTRFEYSNTGYFLLAQAVEHAAEQTLDAYLRARVFEPLGMESTLIRDDRARVIPARAIGYTPRGDRWRIEMSGWEQTGPGSVMSTVLDLAKWDANFYDPKVGGTALVDALQARGELSDGTRLDYAAGLIHGSYRGQPTVWHAGGWAGYRSQFERFVELETSIIVLCNSTSARPDLFAHEIADILFEDDLVEASHIDGDVFPGSRPQVELSRAQLDAWVATYREVSTGELMVVERSEQSLVLVTMGERIPIEPTSPSTFQIEADAVVLEFGEAEPRRTLTIKGPMFEDRFVEAEPLHPTAQQLGALAGRYRSDELGTEWTLSLSDGTLVAAGPVFEEAAPLVTAVEDEYSTTALGGTLRFERDGSGEVTGFFLDINRMWEIRFERVR